MVSSPQKFLLLLQQNNRPLTSIQFSSHKHHHLQVISWYLYVIERSIIPCIPRTVIPEVLNQIERVLATVVILRTVTLTVLSPPGIELTDIIFGASCEAITGPGGVFKCTAIDGLLSYLTVGSTEIIVVIDLLQV